jgi:OPA family sugar phosphate sensor protein UhpC-like MFS transporter
MNKLFRIFQPAPHLPQIQDAAEIEKDYKYWRIRIFYSMFIGYALYYFTRKSFTFAMPGLISDLGFDKMQLGILGTVISIAYGISKFVSGILSDHSNPRYFMAVGLIFTGVCNILFGFSSSLLAFCFFWGLNGIFQGFGWPPCARLLTHWYSHSERGSWWSSWNVSHNVGAYFIPWIVGYCLYYFGWRMGMYVPGVISIFGGIYLINRLRDTPQSLGLPPVEKFRNDYGGVNPSEVKQERELSTKEILFQYVLGNPFIWLLAAAYFFVYIVRTGVNDWTALYLIESKGYSSLGANGVVSMFEVGGFCGSLTAGWSSDYFFKARRGPVNLLFACVMLLTLSLFWWTAQASSWVDSLIMFGVGFSIFGPQMMIGVHAAELAHKKAAATATGFIGCFAYMGAACAGYPLGKLTQDWGWDGYFSGMLFCCLMSALLLFPLWNVTEKSKNKDLKEAEV